MLSSTAAAKLHMYTQDYLKRNTLENSFLSFSFANTLQELLFFLLILDYASVFAKRKQDVGGLLLLIFSTLSVWPDMLIDNQI